MFRARNGERSGESDWERRGEEELAVGGDEGEGGSLGGALQSDPTNPAVNYFETVCFSCTLAPFDPERYTAMKAYSFYIRIVRFRLSVFLQHQFIRIDEKSDMYATKRKIR